MLEAMTPSQLQKVILEKIAAGSTDRRIGAGQHYLSEAVREACPKDDQPNRYEMQEAIWSLVGRGLAYIDIFQRAPENWELLPTKSGRAALTDEAYNPDDPSGYLSRLYDDIPGLTPVAAQYIEEALQTYFHKSYLASTVMLGVAAEAIVLDVGSSMAKWLNNTSGEKLDKALANQRLAYNKKFDEFRKRLLTSASDLPSELSHNLDLQVSPVLDLLRVNRNDAGHPTGIKGDRDETFVSLRIFARAAARLYALKEYFEENAGTASLDED